MDLQDAIIEAGFNLLRLDLKRQLDLTFYISVLYLLMHVFSLTGRCFGAYGEGVLRHSEIDHILAPSRQGYESDQLVLSVHEIYSRLILALLHRDIAWQVTQYLLRRLN